MANESQDDESVGYCKPPVKTRFQKGKSGNPRGRPKKSKNFSTLVEKGLDAEITIVEGDKRRRLTKREAFALTLISKGLVLHPRAVPALLQLVEKQDSRIEEKQAQEQAQGLGQDDEELMRRFFPLTESEKDDD